MGRLRNVTLDLPTAPLHPILAEWLETSGFNLFETPCAGAETPTQS